MNKAGRIGKSVILVVYLLAVHALAGFFIFERWVAPHIRTDDSFVADVRSPTEETPAPTTIPVPEITETNTNAAETNSNANYDFNQTANQNSAIDANAEANRTGAPSEPGALVIPVAGIAREQLQDTFTASRSNGRGHDAIDIMAPSGAPVVAAVDGEIAKFFDSEAGGTTIYQYGPDKKTVYYYAHLQRRADNIREKDYIKRGTVIGYVGDTGNAGPGNYHLHFSIALLNDPNRYWEGRYINPYPLLAAGTEAR